MTLLLLRPRRRRRIGGISGHVQDFPSLVASVHELATLQAHVETAPALSATVTSEPAA